MKMETFFKIGMILTAVIITAGCNNDQKGVHETRIIAHRGYWKTEGSAQNSLASLRKAAEIGCYGSEFDVLLTADGVAIVNHDPSIDGVDIETSDYSAFADVTLGNGEKLPTLREYLTEGAKYPELKLILEIKSASTPEHESRSVKVVMDMVGEMGLAGQVEYIAFSYHICREIVARDPSAVVAYLNGDKTPAELKEDGIPGLDYHIGIAQNNPALFDIAREAGISTNIWTVNDEEQILQLISYGADFITTDEPVLALSLIAEMSGKQ